MRRCKLCNKEKIVSEIIGFCGECIRDRFEDIKEEIYSVHKKIREKIGLSPEIPKSKNGIKCNICGNECIIGEGERGYCGLRENKGEELISPGEKGNLSYYYDPLPTNCVGEWICDISRKKNLYLCVSGYKNLAVFYNACSFNCLFCQNYIFKNYTFKKFFISPEQLAEAVDEKTACVCYFGGDPGPQIIHSIKASKLIEEKRKDVRICWETNGNLNPKFLEEILNIALETNGTVKFDLKTYSENLNIALCGVSNRKTKENFIFASKFFEKRKEPPVLIASTLLVPGYIDEYEIKNIVNFIYELNPSIPFSLLIFHPEYYMNDLPITPKEEVFKYYRIASEKLKRVKIGNIHLIS